MELTQDQKDDAIETICDWYQEWKAKALTEGGQIVQDFMAAEFERRFPFLKEVKIQ